MEDTEETLDHLSATELGGAWRRLCGSLLIEAALACSNDRVDRSYRYSSRSEVNERIRAKKWIDGGFGIIMFDDACLSVNLEPDETRELIKSPRGTKLIACLRRAHVGKTSKTFSRRARYGKHAPSED